MGMLNRSTRKRAEMDGAKLIFRRDDYVSDFRVLRVLRGLFRIIPTGADKEPPFPLWDKPRLALRRQTHKTRRTRNRHLQRQHPTGSRDRTPRQAKT